MAWDEVTQGGGASSNYQILPGDRVDVGTALRRENSAVAVCTARTADSTSNLGAGIARAAVIGDAKIPGRSHRATDISAAADAKAVIVLWLNCGHCRASRHRRRQALVHDLPKGAYGG